MFHCQNASLQAEGGNINDLENIDKWKGLFIASLKKVSLSFFCFCPADFGLALVFSAVPAAEILLSTTKRALEAGKPPNSDINSLYFTYLYVRIHTYIHIKRYWNKFIRNSQLKMMLSVMSKDFVYDCWQCWWLSLRPIRYR